MIPLDNIGATVSEDQFIFHLISERYNTSLHGMVIAFCLHMTMSRKEVAMKNFKTALIITMLFFLPALSHSAQFAGELYIRHVEGDVLVKAAGAGEWVPASMNTPLRENDRVWVADNGRAEMVLSDGSRVRMNRSTGVEVLTAQKDAYQFHVGMGSIFINYSGPKDGVLGVETPTLSLRSFNQAAFRVDVGNNGDSEASVYRGEIYTDRAAGQTRIGTGQRIVMGRGTSTPQLATARAADEWYNWNIARDGEFSGSAYTANAGYLPEELQPYAGELNRYGRWVSTPDYGNVWTPTVIAVTDWSPYRLGRWYWWGNDYTWISYEPWGWVPYHYGRWAYIGTYGWCWVPPARGAVYWGPGYVGWDYASDYVSWVPLAPGDIYYGYGYYGPGSVNIFNININTFNFNRHYRNKHIRNSIISTHRDGFMRGRHLRADIRQTPFTGRNTTVGAPRFTPTRAAHMPVVRDISPTKLPPQRIRDLQVTDLKKRYPSISLTDKSIPRPLGTLQGTLSRQSDHSRIPLTRNFTGNTPGGTSNITGTPRGSTQPKTGLMPNTKLQTGALSSTTQATTNPEFRVRRQENFLNELRTRRQGITAQPDQVTPGTAQTRQLATPNTSTGTTSAGIRERQKVFQDRQAMIMNRLRAPQQGGSAPSVQSQTPVRPQYTPPVQMQQSTPRFSAPKQQIPQYSPPAGQSMTRQYGTQKQQIPRYTTPVQQPQVRSQLPAGPSAQPRYSTPQPRYTPPANSIPGIIHNPQGSPQGRDGGHRGRTGRIASPEIKQDHSGNQDTGRQLPTQSGRKGGINI